MADELELRLLRHFVTVAEELHFRRAAERLFIAQQALSRDIRRLEDRVGTPLLTRSTRSVELTDAGRRLLPRAKEMLALHDLALRELRDDEPLVVDVVDAELTPALVLEAVRSRASGSEFIARFGQRGDGGRGSSADVVFDRVRRPSPEVSSQLVRFEPLAVLVPERHPLADRDAVAFEDLRGTRVCSRAGGHVTEGWIDATAQLLAPFGIDPAIGHPVVAGGEELAQHLRLRSAPVLALASQQPVEGAVLLPVVDPIPLFPWAMSWRSDLDHPGLDELREAARRLTETRGWLDVPAGAWLPSPESRSAG
ncbi:LysR family transcriptional regulator [Microbacterium sp. TPD7012]|uniref:LysR family transcriptional regulator n=1 Tax=Microbacterium sp. TPD7012 TaxID=2171975 RepID=UPI000D51943D|nr:LysR family transcriptional regulator [Microbacterium sp. TPD7012]PVE96971.1 LysR family transcriptional regulator [Microbacterium sp. TPD7012]